MFITANFSLRVFAWSLSGGWLSYFLAGDTMHRLSAKKPKLIVLIAVDGLRGDLLSRYAPAFTGGFKRIQKAGFDFTNAWVDHAITVSHAGHVTLATGDYPKTHGIVDAAYYRKKGAEYFFTDAFADSSYTVTGYRDKSISCTNVLTTGLTEWINDNDPQAKTLSVGTGNISSALYCFRSNEEAYWLGPGLGRYVTSTYFLKTYPDWINDFNVHQMRELVRGAVTWNISVPEQFRTLCNKDNESYEAAGGITVFPHIMEKEIAAEYARDSAMGPALWFGNTPYADVATIALAKTGIRALRLGQRNHVDFLSIVLSQVDNNSHFYGPFSLETFDAILRIDRALGEFLDYLDKTVGRDNYVLALSADHGFPDVPEHRLQHGEWAQRISSGEIEAVMKDLTDILSQKKPEADMQCEMAAKLKSLSYVADVYTDKVLEDQKYSGDPYLELYKKSFRTDRIPRLPLFSLENFKSIIAEHGLMVRLKENAIPDIDVDVHGSPYRYDRYVPLYFYGGLILPRRSSKKVSTIDVAPSLAKLASIKTPHTDGKSLF